MALPKKKMSRARRHKRRSQKKIKPCFLIKCSQCQRMIFPHQVCPYCGTYKGRVVLDIEAKEKKRKEKRKKKKEKG